MMHFKLEYAIIKMPLNKDTSLQFHYGGPHKITVSLRTDAEKKIGHQMDHAFCTATSQVEPPAHVLVMFESLAHNKLPPGSKRPNTLQS